jgi:hypothetical protein
MKALSVFETLIYHPTFMMDTSKEEYTALPAQRDSCESSIDCENLLTDRHGNLPSQSRKLSLSKTIYANTMRIVFMALLLVVVLQWALLAQVGSKTPKNCCLSRGEYSNTGLDRHNSLSKLSRNPRS